MSTPGGAGPSEPRAALLAAYRAALARVDGRGAVARFLAGYRGGAPSHALAIGKAAAYMMAGAFEVLGERLRAGLVVTKHGHAPPLLPPAAPVRTLEASHPVPDETSLAAGEAVVEFLQAAPGEARFLVMVSGGASSLVEVLPPGLEAADLARLNEWLLGAGLAIGDMNRVRKRLSTIKAGRLAGPLAGRAALLLMISDVPGDDPRVIGSGPLVAHQPADIDCSHLALPDWLAPLAARPPALPPAEAFARVEAHVIAAPADARRAAAATLAGRGLAVREHPRLLEGDACAVGARLGRRLIGAAPGVEVWAGETTVVLPERPGRGGRCQALALAAALEIAGREACWLLAAGTDGSDGPGEDAGALVDGATVARGQGAGHDPRARLAAADAGTFLEASGDLLRTGPTGTNVMDLVIALRG